MCLLPRSTYRNNYILFPCDDHKKVMELTTVFSLVIIIARTCLAANILSIETSKQDESCYLAQATVEILKSCYGNQVKTLGLAGNLDGCLIKTLQSTISLPVALLDSTRRLVGHDCAQQKCRYKLQFHVVTASSSTELEELLRAIKESIWWNHMASIFILASLPASEDGCSKAFEMLSAAWKMNLLNSKLICLHRTKEILIYTYNPYVGIAPDRWEVQNTYRWENDHPWTLFVRRYRDNKEICEELDFDKTKDLGGYEIRATVNNAPGDPTVDSNKTGIHRVHEFAVVVPASIFGALNGTLKFRVYNHTTFLEHTKDNEKNILMDAINGISDMVLHPWYPVVDDSFTTTFPVFYSGLSVVTQYSGEMSQLSKIRSVVDGCSQMGILFVTVITLIFFILFLRQSLVPAMLNTLRIICNGSLPMVPKNLAPRFYLGSLFMFVVTIQALYQGKLAALLTNPILLPNVNSMQDLNDGNYTVYGYESLERFFRPPAFNGSFVKLQNFSCTQYVLHDSSAACVTERGLLIEQVASLKLYLSKDIIVKLPVSYVIRKDWPLEPKVNKILTTLFEANFIRHEFMRVYEKILKARERYEKQEETPRFNNITLDELAFAFVIIGIGLGCATICFIVEIGISTVRSYD